MAKSKKSERKKSVSVHDMAPVKDPKGGAPASETLSSNIKKKKDDAGAAVIAKIG